MKYWLRREEIRQLKRAGRLQEAVRALIECVEIVEARARIRKVTEGSPEIIAPFCYEQLALIYAEEKRYKDAVEILRRYANNSHGGIGKLAGLLEKTEEQLSRADAS